MDSAQRALKEPSKIIDVSSILSYAELWNLCFLFLGQWTSVLIFWIEKNCSSSLSKTGSPILWSKYQWWRIYMNIVLTKIKHAFLIYENDGLGIDIVLDAWLQGRIAVCNLAVSGTHGPVVSGDLAQRKLFIGGLSYETTTETLISIFSQYGEIEEGSVAYDKSTNKSRYVVMKVSIFSTGRCTKYLKSPSYRVIYMKYAE